MNCNLPSLIRTFTNTRRWRAIGLLFVVPSLLFAQTFEVKSNSKEVVLGSSFEIAFSLKGARGERFKAPEFSDFKIVGGPNEMRGVVIINGRSSSHQTWSYELEPRRTGTFTIGPANVVVDGKTLSTPTLTVKVVSPKSKPSVNLPPGISDNLFIVGELDHNEAYIGQQITWRIKLYTQLSLEGADIIELPDFEGFYSKEKRRFDTRVTYQTVNGKKYAVKTLHEEAIFPQKSEDLFIGVARVRVGVEEPPGTFRSFLGPKPVILQTQPLTLAVKALPDPWPDNFTGGVGQYNWQVEIDRDTLSTDDAITLTIALRGNGDSKRFAAPKLALPEGLEGFEPRIAEEEVYENGEELVHSKVLEYVILPKEPGEYSIVPSLTYFDPDSNRFVELKADHLPTVKISAGKNYHPDQADIDTPPLPTTSPGMEAWEKVSEWLHSPILWSLLALPISLFGIFYLLKKQKNKPAKPIYPSEPLINRPSAKAIRERFLRVAPLLHGGQPRAFYDELFKVLQSYLAARFQLTPAQMTQENIRTALTERGVPAGTIQNLLVVWQTCEQALFAGQSLSAQMESTWRAAESVVQDLERTPRHQRSS